MSAKKTVRVTVTLPAGVAAELRRLELKEAAFQLPANARTLSESLCWLASQAARTGDLNPLLAHRELTARRTLATVEAVAA